MKKQIDLETPHEKILKKLSMKFNLPLKDIKKIVQHNFLQLNKAFGKEGVSSIEWVGMGKFIVSEPKAKFFIKKKLEKIYNGKLIMKLDGFDERLTKIAIKEEENIRVIKTKIKNEETHEHIRGMEEQLASQKFPKGRDPESGKGEDGDM